MYVTDPSMQAKAAMYEQMRNQSNAIGVATASPPPLTIASALSRMDGLNERIGQAIGRLEHIAGQLGTLHPAEANSKAGQIPNGAVGRLNDVADQAHDRMCAVEALLSGIERALG